MGVGTLTSGPDAGTRDNNHCWTPRSMVGHPSSHISYLDNKTSLSLGVTSAQLRGPSTPASAVAAVGDSIRLDVGVNGPARGNGWRSPSLDRAKTRRIAS